MRAKKIFIPASSNSKITKFWDFNKNKDIDINMTSERERKLKVNWRCKKCGYEWQSTVNDRYESTGKCPCCECRHVILPGVNDVATLVPEIMTELDEEKNKAEGISIKGEGVGSKKIVNWKCSICGRKFDMAIVARVKKQKDGSYRFVSCRHNDYVKHLRDKTPMASDVSKIIKFWDNEKNSLDPKKTPANSTEKAFWKCKKCGYEWSTLITSRYHGNDKCPCCETGKKIYPGVNDIVTLVPEIMTEWDEEKNKKEGISIVGEGVESKKMANWKCPVCGKRFRKIIGFRVYRLENGSYQFRPCTHGNNVPKVSDIPELMKFWDKNKNILNPEETPINSKEKAFWKCKKCGYEWKSSISTRYGSSDKCMCCDYRKVIRPGINDVATLIPEIMTEWDEEKNKKEGISIAGEGIGSRTKAYWKCPICGKESYIAIGSRIIKKKDGTYHFRSCLHKNNIKVSEVPELMRFWDGDKNTLDPSKTISSSHSRAFWKCKKCGYEWETTISSRNNDHGKCICCELNQVTKKGVNDFFSILPEAKKFYNYEKNKDLDPYSHGLRSKKTKFWWKCPKCGYEWQNSFAWQVEGSYANNNLKFSGCPFCNTRNITPGVDSFKALHPDIMNEWLDLPNSFLADPDRVSDKSKIKVWWCCLQGHHYSMSISDRLMYQKRHKESCPYCKGHRQRLRHFY